MPRRARLISLAVRLWRRSDPEYRQALARVCIVAGALWYAFSSFFATHAPSETAIVVSRWTAVGAGVVSASILLSILYRPGESRIRRLAGITHDIVANSITMSLGGEATAFFSVIYVVVILASGVRFGVGYLSYAALCSLVGFGLLHRFSPYWGANLALTVNVVLVLTVVPAYMYRLIKARQQGREELERRATHDSLTGLMNRAGFETQLEKLVVPGTPDQVLIYLDLDRFKAVNDSAGHAAGDKLLAEVANILRDCVRDEDVSARIGGDEFCVFLRECSLPLGQQIATRVKDRIHDFRMEWGGQRYSVGASIGVVSSSSAEDGPTFMRLADAACYAAKNAGRNTVFVVDASRSRMDTGEIRALHLDE